MKFAIEDLEKKSAQKRRRSGCKKRSDDLFIFTQESYQKLSFARKETEY